MIGLKFVAIGLALAAVPRPTWTKAEVKTLLGRAQQAGRSPSVAHKDLALVRAAGAAYRLAAQANEGVEGYAKRILKQQDAKHVNVSEGQWLTALMRHFYKDLAVRSQELARFETDRKDRSFFERVSKEAAAAADALGRTLRISVEGLEGLVQPLPVYGGDEPKAVGAFLEVKGGAVFVERVERVKFKNDRPPKGAPRTGKGALREVYSALKQYNMSAKMFAQFDRKRRKHVGHVRAVVPAAMPALYLNEIVRAAKQAKTHTVHVMTLSKEGELRELPFRVLKPKRRRKAKKKQEWVQLGCKDEQPMSLCVRRLAHARAQGHVLYKLE